MEHASLRYQTSKSGEVVSVGHSDLSPDSAWHFGVVDEISLISVHATPKHGLLSVYFDVYCLHAICMYVYSF